MGETDAEIEQKLERLRQPISFYGSTRSYHGVFAAHGYVVVFRRANAVGILSVLAQVATPTLEDAVALAKAMDAALLCKENDFPLTDIGIA